MKRRIYVSKLKKNVSSVYWFNLDDKEPLKLYPAIERVEKKQGSNFSIICTTERMKYYSSNFHWFKGNGSLPKTATTVRYPTFLRLDFSDLKVYDTGIYICNVTDNKNLQEKRFQLIVFGKWFGSFDKTTNSCHFGFHNHQSFLKNIPVSLKSRANLLPKIIGADDATLWAYFHHESSQLPAFNRKNT